LTLAGRQKCATLKPLSPGIHPGVIASTVAVRAAPVQ